MISFMGDRDVTLAERLIDALHTIPLARWRTAALAAAPDARQSLAAARLEQALTRLDPMRLWELRDDLQTALHRLASDEACGVVRGRRERDRIRDATRRATDALVAEGELAPAEVESLAGPFVALLEEGRDAEAAPDPKVNEGRVVARTGAYLRLVRSSSDPPHTSVTPDALLLPPAAGRVPARGQGPEPAGGACRLDRRLGR